jgi:hypothetical protein
MLNLKHRPVKILTVLIALLILVLNSIVIAAFAMGSSETEDVPVVAETTSSKEVVQEIILKETPILFPDLDYEIYYDLNSYNSFLEKVQASRNQLLDAITSQTYTSAASAQMIEEAERLENIIFSTEQKMAKIVSWENDYYYAAKTWEFFRQRGYSEAVTSAIIGNMMIETSGGSLALVPDIYDATGDYYGLCQWSLYYRPEVAGMSFEEQLVYLEADMEKEFKTFGKCYRRGFTYEDFLAMDDPAEAARAFAMVYERCATWSYALRTEPAVVAYNYFT